MPGNLSPWMFVFVIMAMALGRVLGGPSPRRKEEIAKGVALAKQVAGSPQRILSIRIPGNVILDLREDNSEMREVKLIFPPRHPDFERLRTQVRFGRIRFNFQDQPIPRMNQADAVAYLRLAEETVPVQSRRMPDERPRRLAIGFPIPLPAARSGAPGRVAALLLR